MMMMMMIHSICMAPYICLKKHSKARAPPIKLAFKCLKEDVSFECSFEVVKVVNFANTEVFRFDRNSVFFSLKNCQQIF